MVHFFFRTNKIIKLRSFGIIYYFVNLFMVSQLEQTFSLNYKSYFENKIITVMLFDTIIYLPHSLQ